MSVLKLRADPPERIDLSGVSPASLAKLSESLAGHLAVGTSRQGVTLGDLFAITLDGSDTLTIEGGSTRLDRVGAGLSAGSSIHVEGDVGQRLGEGMKGGALTVTGSAGPFAASAATGGSITIQGDADERAGGALYAAKAGLDGATLVIHGRAGAHLGDRMRRGLILVGEAGPHAASRMVAGTIVAQKLGDHPGFGMRRGTLVAGTHGALLPTFVETGTPDLVYLKLLAKTLQRMGASQAELLKGAMRRYGGDLATIGKGELFTPAGRGQTASRSSAMRVFAKR